MSFEIPGANALDEVPCRYGDSRLLFRGPRRALTSPYTVFLGGIETYGKFVSNPFPALLEKVVATPCLNLGCVNAGLDAFVHDNEVARIARNARLTVLQVMGAQNLSNRFYRVHPRRNDRFLQASALLAKTYREVDFTEFHFNKHLLNTLFRLSPERFATVREELQSAWLGRMRVLLRNLGHKPLLLWLRYETPENAEDHSPLGSEPLLVTREMLDAIAKDVLGIIEVPVVPAGYSGDLVNMCFGPLQAPAAEQMIGPAAHADIAEELISAVRSAI